MKDDKGMIIDVREEHLHENYMIEAKIKKKVDKVKEEAVVGAYQQPRAVYSRLVDDIMKDPATKMGLGKILHCFLLDHVFTNTIFAGTAISHKSLARSLQRKRKSSFGDNKLPSSWKDLEDIPEQFTKSSTGRSSSSTTVRSTAPLEKGSLASPVHPSWTFSGTSPRPASTARSTSPSGPYSLR